MLKQIGMAIALAVVSAAAVGTDWTLPGVSRVQPNAYGYGTNMDQYGRAHSYRDAQGAPLAPMYQNDVKRDAYGFGVHMDPFGNRVFDGQPRWLNDEDQ